MTSTTLMERELELIALVARAFPAMSLNAFVIDVHKLGAGQASTLRFTLDEAFSTDLERDRVLEGSEAAKDLAAEVEAALRQQIGPGVGSTPRRN